MRYVARMRTVLELEGMPAVHAARLVHTALQAVPGIACAEVVIGRATLEHAAPLDGDAVRAVLAAVGVTVRALTTERRVLPVR